jgi:hypothetical protein
MKKTATCILWTMTALLLLTGCAAKNPLTAEEVKILDSVTDLLEEQEIVYLPELCSSRTIVAAQQMFKPYEGTAEEHRHEHGKAGEEEQGHHYILIVEATPAADGTYQQPVVKMGPTRYFYKELYTIRLEGKSLAVSKSLASEGNSSRSEAAVEPELLRKIAETVNGRLEGSGIALP